MNYDEYESEFYDHSLDPFTNYEEYLDSHITKEDLMYLGDIELARQLKEEVTHSPLRATTPRLKYSRGSSSSPRRGISSRPNSTSRRTRPNPLHPPYPTAKPIPSLTCLLKGRKKYSMGGGSLLFSSELKCLAKSKKYRDTLTTPID